MPGASVLSVQAPGIYLTTILDSLLPRSAVKSSIIIKSQVPIPN